MKWISTRDASYTVQAVLWNGSKTSEAAIVKMLMKFRVRFDETRLAARSGRSTTFIAKGEYVLLRRGAGEFVEGIPARTFRKHYRRAKT